MRIVVIRAFYLEGAVQPAGAVIEVDDRLGRELLHNRKAAPEPAAAPRVEADAGVAPDAKPVKKGKTK